MSAVIAICLTGFLIYNNHKQLPTEDDVFNITKNWSLPTEEVYFVRKIEGEWLTIFKSTRSNTIARLEQNWLGDWKMKDYSGYEGTVASVSLDYLPSEAESFNWTAGSSIKTSHYFGQIYNPDIKQIKAETEKNFFEDALIINSGENRFFLAISNGELVLPVNIKGYSNTGELIYSTVK